MWHLNSTVFFVGVAPAGNCAFVASVKSEAVSIDTSRLSELVENDALAVLLRREKLEKGELVAIVDDMEVATLKKGDYFGELALLRDAERAVDIVATSTSTKVVTIDRSSFVRLLGPLEDTLKERSRSYKGFEGL